MSGDWFVGGWSAVAMTTSKLEEVARAIEAEASKTDPLPFDVCLAFSRAAIEAMREPSEAMAKAGELRMVKLGWDEPSVLGLGESGVQSYRRMIDAALAEGGEG